MGDLKRVQALLHERNRRDARKGLIHFIRKVAPWFVIEEIHLLIARHLEDLVFGRNDRLMIFMPPRTGKSQIASIFLPAWYMGLYPHRKVMQASHSSELATDFGREVRNQVADEDYQDVFPGVDLRPDSKAAGRWHLTGGGVYVATGVGGGIAGKGFNLGIVDDPLSEQDAYSEAKKKGVKRWWGPGFYTRRQPESNVILVMSCMTGDTPVMCADGSIKELRKLKPGEAVATYRDGRLGISRVTNWTSSGVDSILKIRTSSGITVRANERHPFLVYDNGEEKWIRVKDLRPGQSMLRVNGVSGRVKPACHLGVTSRPKTGGTAPRITTKSNGQVASDIHPTTRTKRVTLVSNIDTASQAANTTSLLRSKVGSVPFAESHQGKTSGHIGAESCASIIVTRPGKSEGCCATTAILSLDMPGRPKSQRLQPHTSDFILDEIVEISPDGVEEVFDVEIEETENFIANGLVSHNTRWSKDDLPGFLLAAAKESKKADQWKVLEIPALVDEKAALALNKVAENPLLRSDEFPRFLSFKPGDSFSPRRWPLAELHRSRSNMPSRDFEALYQQKPVEDEGNILKRSWWRKWKGPLTLENVVQVYDTAFEEGEENAYSARTTWGVFMHTDTVKIAGRPVTRTRHCCLLMEAWRDRVGAPGLREEAVEAYKHFKFNGKPVMVDRVLVEKKASGHGLIQELRRAGVPVYPMKAEKSKVARAHAASMVPEQGAVFYPADATWAEAVINECADFPYGEFADWTDTCVHAWNWMRRTYKLDLNTDPPDDDDDRDRQEGRGKLFG